eukprot:CAMPEP_0172518818 /NCGR_PEP_ID=MMETSP1066-20121228/291034_1 /TAXON_ID=671091 /ORGANISM="Coscinodiscus wailesii, Strain CCMP2513" /LENGTH=137 /DNA_ID=CAMNT_0013301269 /DNA_START=707 /DNA_END=1120 /DNA_ORIENTATION=-
MIDYMLNRVIKGVSVEHMLRGMSRLRIGTGRVRGIENSVIPNLRCGKWYLSPPSSFRGDDDGPSKRVMMACVSRQLHPPLNFLEKTMLRAAFIISDFVYTPSDNIHGVTAPNSEETNRSTSSGDKCGFDLEMTLRIA